MTYPSIKYALCGQKKKSLLDKLPIWWYHVFMLSKNYNYLSISTATASVPSPGVYTTDGLYNNSSTMTNPSAYYPTNHPQPTEIITTDSDHPDHIVPLNDDEDMYYNLAKLTIRGNPDMDDKLFAYLRAGWEPMGALANIETDSFTLILRRLEHK